jgi:hypothetical protein
MNIFLECMDRFPELGITNKYINLDMAPIAVYILVAWRWINYFAFAAVHMN